MSESFHFNDYSVASYGAMIEDARRTGPFVEALRQAIGPDSVMLDIGSGTGLSMSVSVPTMPKSSAMYFPWCTSSTATKMLPGCMSA